MLKTYSNKEGSVMASRQYERLSHEGRVLVDQTMEKLDPLYDPERGLVGMYYHSRRYYDNRSSMYYALALLLLDVPGCAEKAEKIIHTVIGSQIDAPEEIFHGARICHQPVRFKLSRVYYGIRVDYRLHGLYLLHSAARLEVMLRNGSIPVKLASGFFSHFVILCRTVN